MCAKTENSDDSNDTLHLIDPRLQSKVIEYEESGWYDGDIEEKSDVEKARDLFLYRSNVKPVEERLKKTAVVVGSTWLASCVVLNVATSMNPIFNQYDPKMLEKLSYDDKVAEVVQRQSNGRPTYCENRYYRAVANGGQGKKTSQMLLARTMMISSSRRY